MLHLTVTRSQEVYLLANCVIFFNKQSILYDYLTYIWRLKIVALLVLRECTLSGPK